ncbi:MAG: glycine betaine ABC transporter substrate-binding protein [Kiloniellales bacterium]|nr:glycine betaine ABC transporter substrate-binding protein [Kiloniellales bacterium]MDJ0983604.1 glycine betaine ABC transporter substrate-binding protein [Kiloniellales bacterium]
MKRLSVPSLRRSLAGLLLAASAFGLAACEEEPPVLRVAGKNFTENMLMAEMLAQLAEREGITVQRAIPYGRSAEVFEALKQGKIDIYPEYNGTGLVYLGQPAMADGKAALARVRALYGPLELTWGESLGFSNDYVLVMRPEEAQSLGVGKISDLAGLGPLEIATDTDFLERPLDGLGALIRRYGLTEGKVQSYALGDGGKDKIVQALLDGEVKVAELFRTDSQIAAFDLAVLDDDLGFFPVYEPSPLVREDALARFPKLSGAMTLLQGKVTADAMRDLIAQVELEGRSVPAVALAFLADVGLVDETAEVAGGGAETLTVALGGLDSLSGPAGRAVRASKAVFPKRSIDVARAANPLDLVTSGEARLAVVGTESFYSLEDGAAVLSSSAEALGVVGYRLAHVMVPGSGAASLAEVKRLGVGEAGSASDRIARNVLAGLDIEGVELISGESGDLKAQVEAMSKGLVDAVFVMAPLGDSAVLDIMETGRYRLLSVEGWSQGNAPIRFSFLRPAKVPAGTYPGQAGAVETLSTQMVLAGPSSEREAFGAQGPGTTGTAATQPIPDETVRKLAAALGSTEVVDPAAPVAAALRPALEEGPQPLVADLPTSLINILATAFLAWMIYLLFARAPKSRLKEPPADLHITPAKPND